MDFQRSASRIRGSVGDEHAWDLCEKKRAWVRARLVGGALFADRLRIQRDVVAIRKLMLNTGLCFVENDVVWNPV